MHKHILAVIIAVTLMLCGIGVYAEDETETGAEAVILDLNAKANVLMEASTGRVLYSNKPDAKLPMASVTKVMTMLLTMEAIDSGRLAYDDIVVASERAKSMGGSTIFLDTGEEMSVHDLLKGIAVASGNDACVAIAEHIAGSEEAFVSMMNSRAAELGMVNSSFKNTNGLDAEGHYSSALDIAIMTRELLKHPKILEYTTIWMDGLRGGKFQLANTNKLIRFYKGANGMKTGSTDEALYCLSGTAMRNDMQLIAVVLGAPTSAERFADASKLLDFGFANYSIKQIVTAGESLGTVNVMKGLLPTVEAVAGNSFNTLVSKGGDAQIRRETAFGDNLEAPIKVGDKLGEIMLFQEDIQVGSVDIVAAGNVDRLTFSAMWSKTLWTWMGSMQ